MDLRRSPDSRRGVGLGLAICQGMIQSLGGRITAANRPQGGAEFIVSLPCDQQMSPMAAGDLPVAATS